MKIFCPRALLLPFRRECRERFPHEHIAALFGQRSNEGNIVITRLAPIKHKATAEDIRYQSIDIHKSKMSGLRKGEEWIGTIHSHCDSPNDPCCWHLSKSDIQSALSYGETVCGIVFVTENGSRTDVHWYIPHPIPEVFYDEKAIRLASIASN